MKVVETEIEGVIILEPSVFEDVRGHFFESYNKRDFSKYLPNLDFVQDNQSFSTYGVLRGLHFQRGESAQSKLVRVLQGEILDVAVDLRTESKTYLQYVKAILSDENKRQLFIPKGFAHGFVVLSETATVLYKCDEFYNPQAEDGLRYDDPKLNIDWGIDESSLIINRKDLEYQFL
ncbi:MAG: dTDP-4-dehydrorhamnose 3,5-epimerase [Chitinophagales bacterium]|nr:dTDP-4-dehydrorhamnose 3,5-epimerase [Chitinophagales bacterium]